MGPMARFSLRRFPILHTAVAVLPRHRIVFNVPGLPPEPAMANLQPEARSEVHGVVHWVSRADFDRLSISEAVVPEGSPLSALPEALKVATAREVTVSVHVGPREQDTLDVLAKTFFFYGERTPSFIRSAMKPSRRYVQVAVDGAEFWGLDQRYVRDFLGNVETAKGLLGGFGLIVEPRPHLLDRPNPDIKFGKASSEIYSPWQPIRAKKAVEVFEENEKNTREDRLTLLHLSNIPKDIAKKRRKMYYVPGIDGTGKSILSQVDQIDEDGEWVLSSIRYPYANRQALEELVGSIIELVYDDAQGQPVSIVGESMGGALTIMLARENIRRKLEGTNEKTLDIDLALMINPATCYKRANPRPLWDFLLSFGFSQEQYSALLPFVLLPFIVDIESATQDIGPNLVPRLRNMLLSLSKVANILPQDALSHRMKILADFSLTGSELAELSGEFGPRDVAVISTVNDNLIPSLSENYRLQRHIPNMYSTILPYGGHAPMFDKRFALPGLLKPFKRKAKTMTPMQSRVVSPSLEKRRVAMRKKLEKSSTDENPTAQKSRAELRKLTEFLGEWNKNCSPVFIGEENLPEPSEGRPVLFISNHTLLGWLDGMYPSLRLASSKRVLLRPLAHPALFKSPTVFLPGATTATQEEVTQFGIVMVSPNALLEQLGKGNWCMLFPGGAREALKGVRDEKYSLHWPESPEFIRPCALFGATIVPVSTVGAEDMVKLLVDTEAMGNIVRTGNDLLGRPVDIENIFGDNSRKWTGRSTTESSLMVPPLAVPAGPDRLYFRFGKPIEVPLECLDDPILCKEVYKKTKQSVAEGVDILLRRREADAYRSVEKRNEFWDSHGHQIEPPAGPGWAWTKGDGAYLDEDLQPPL